MHVFAWQRYASLVRLCSSLLATRYFGLEVQLVFNLEGNATAAIVEFVRSFDWPHGSVLVRAMQIRVGLEKVCRGVKMAAAWNDQLVDDHERLEAHHRR